MWICECVRVLYLPHPLSIPLKHGIYIHFSRVRIMCGYAFVVDCFCHFYRFQSDKISAHFYGYYEYRIDFSTAYNLDYGPLYTGLQRTINSHSIECTSDEVNDCYICFYFVEIIDRALKLPIAKKYREILRDFSISHFLNTAFVLILDIDIISSYFLLFEEFMNFSI